MDPDLKYWYQVGLVLENKSKVIISGKWPKLTSKNGALFTWLRKLHKIMQIKGSILCFYFKNTHEITQAIKGMHIQKATKYLKDVTLKKQHVPVRCYKWWSW